jgi:type I restriction enzyme, S subunit
VSERRLKHGWRWVKFGDVVRLSSDRCADPAAAGLERYLGLEHFDPADLRLRRWGLVAEGTTFTNRFRPGQVLFGKRRAYQRKVAVADFSGVCSGDIYVLEPANERLLPDLLPFICQTDRFFEHAIGTSAGSLSPRTNWESLARFEFALPPTDHQAALVQILVASAKEQQATNDSVAFAQRVRRSLLVYLCEHGTRRHRTAGAGAGPFPGSWQVLPLGCRYQVQLGKMISEKARTGKGRIPYIRNANVQWRRLDLSDVATMSFSAVEREKFKLRHGDIVACEGRHVGKSMVWRDEIPGACYQKSLHRLRRLSDADVPEYLLACLEYYSLTGRFRGDTGETTIPHLPAEKLRAMLFPFPSREEQEEISGQLESCDRAIAAAERRANCSAALGRELLQAIFHGSLAP